MPAPYLPPVPAPAAPVAALSTAEGFVIACLRLRAARLPHGPDWRDGFAAAGVSPEGAAAFDAFFRIVEAAAPDMLRPRCPRCATLGHDEVLVLRLIGLLQRGSADEAAAVLSHWLCPTARRMALLPAEGLAAALAASGLRLPHRHAAAASWEATAAGGYADRGLGLVH